MIKFFRAVRAEHRKLWHKKSTLLWVFLSAVTAAFIMTASASLLNYANLDDRLWTATDHFAQSIVGGGAAEQWQTDAEEDVEAAFDRWTQLGDLAEDGTYMQRAAAQRERELLARESTVADYRLKNGISPEGGGLWRVLQRTLWLMMQLVCIVACTAASDMFAGEYSRGTVYMNFARPVTRIKQYFAKMFTAWLYAFLLLASAFGGAFITGALLLGDSGGVYVGMRNGEVYQCSWPAHCLDVFGCCFATVVLCIALCAALGTLTRSRAVSSVGAAAVMMAAVWLGDAIAPTLSYVTGLSVISCMDLTVPLMSAANFPGLSFADCCVSCGAHMLIFIIAGYYFMRRDISE